MAGIRSLNDVRPGDIMLGPIGGLTGLAVGLGHLMLREGFRMGELSIRHAGIVVASEAGTALPPLLAQAMPRGAEVVAMRHEQHWTARHAYIRLPEDYPGQAEDAAQLAFLMAEKGVGYSWGSYPSLAAYRLGVRAEWLTRWINRRRPPIPVRLNRPLDPGVGQDWVMDVTSVSLPVEAICSVFTDQAWTMTGKKVMRNVRPQAVTPGALALELSETAGATWALPRKMGARTWVVNDGSESGEVDQGH